MDKCYAIMSQKGGVAKTTTALALSAGLARRKKKVLLIDLDQQGDSTRLSNIEEELISFLMADVINGRCKPQEAIQTTAAGYDIIPTRDGGLAELTLEIKQKVPIKKIVSLVSGDYDYIVIDCPPNIYNLTTQALIAADEVVFPGDCEEPSIQAFNNLMKSVQDVKEMKNKKLRMAGILVIKFDSRRTEMNTAAMNDYQILAENYATKIFDTKIPYSVYISKAFFRRVSIYEYIDDPINTVRAAAVAYDNWITELTGIKSRKRKERR